MGKWINFSHFKAVYLFLDAFTYIYDYNRQMIVDDAQLIVNLRMLKNGRLL